jgi:hypothetical protein
MMFSRPQSQSPVVLVESLESRQLLSTVGVNDGVLTITGDADTANRVTVKATARGRLISATVNGKRRAFSRVGLAGINVTGGNARDIVTIAANVRIPAVVNGGAGNDQITGGAASDTLRGGQGNDTIRGSAGDDYLDGGPGTNRLIGGTGANTLVNLPETPVLEASGPIVETPHSRATALRRADGTVQPFGVDVTTFKNADGSFVRPNDGIDDTTGIQAAIDSFNPFWGFPIGTSSMGGVLYLPGGVYDTSASLRLPGTIVLSGDGPESVIQYNGVGGSAIQMVEASDGDTNSASGLQDLTIRADRGAGVTVNHVGKLVLLQLRFRDLTLDTAGWGINFAGHQTQNSFFENITVKRPGSGALLIEGNVNKVIGVKVVEGVRPGFNANPGVIVVKGDASRVADCVVGPLPAGAGPAFYISGYFPSLSNNRAEVAGVVPTLADGVGFTFDHVESGIVDDLRGRQAKFVHAIALQINRQWVGSDVASLDQLLVRDADSRIMIDEVSGPATVAGVSRVATIARPASDRVHVATWSDKTAEIYFGQPLLGLQRSLTPTLSVGGAAFGVNAKDFLSDSGLPVAGNKTRDDTTGIQRAINSLMVPRGRPAGATAVGGVVYLPAGVYRTTTPLLLPSGVVLVGDGSATVIAYEGRGGAAVQFNSLSGNTVTGAGVENLCVNAEYGAGVGTAAGLVLDQVRVQDVVFNCLGWGVDLRQAVTRTSAFDNIHQRNMGTGTVWVEGDANRLYSVNAEFGVRPGFSAEPAMMVVKGDNNSIIGCIMEGVPLRSATAYYVSGAGLYWNTNWAEIADPIKSSAKDNIAFIFENVHNVAEVDNLHVFTTIHGARFINSNVRIEQLNNMGEDYPLKDYVTLDANSTLEAEWAVVRWWGTGSLDGTAIVIKNLFKKDHPPI